MTEAKYKRALLKFSGEVLAAQASGPGGAPNLCLLTDELKAARDLGVQIAVVVGGGNLIRGAIAAQQGLDRVAADYMGMLATVINGLGLVEILGRNGVAAVLQSALEVRGVAAPFDRTQALAALAEGKIVVFSGGTGHPYLTTDTAAALRAVEIGAEALLVAKSGVDGVYDADPHHDATASKFDRLSFKEAIDRELKVMDTAALCLCRDAGLPIIVFSAADPANICRALRGEAIGTIITNT